MPYRWPGCGQGLSGAMDVEQAYIAGGWAREAGRGMETCPTYMPGDGGRPARDAWKRGWNDMDKKMKGERRG